MCTAANYKTKDSYFGRNLDLDYSYDETITITPRNFPFKFQTVPAQSSHYAIIGIAFVTPDRDGADYPLYYDAINEKGLGIAGLQFADNAVYFPADPTKTNITPYEFIPWLLCSCASVAEARKKLLSFNFLAHNFSEKLPLTPLHWIISDPHSSLVVESTADGLHVYDDPIGVLTNNPIFSDQLINLAGYQSISPTDPENSVAPSLDLPNYSRGLGTKFLPGGMDSESRFVKTAFIKHNSLVEHDDELSSVSQFFHILHSVDQPRGADQTKLSPAEFEITLYSSCYNLNKGIIYYTCYDNHQISSVDMHKTDLDASILTSYPMITTEQVNYQN